MDITMFFFYHHGPIFMDTHACDWFSIYGYWFWNRVTEWASSPFVFFSHAPWARDVWDLCSPTITHSVEIFGLNENSNSQSLKKPSGSTTLNFKWGKTQSTHLVVSEWAPVNFSKVDHHFFTLWLWVHLHVGLFYSILQFLLWHIVCFFLPQKR